MSTNDEVKAMFDVPTASSHTKINSWLSKVARLSALSGRPDEEFFYLGGPMTGIPQFNFPEFDRIAGRLRDMGYNIVSPAELDDPEDHAAAMASKDGSPHTGESNGKLWQDFLARDCVIVSMPTCVGGIFIDGWHRSHGAQLESYLLSRLKKPVYEYAEFGGAPVLIQFDRDERLKDLTPSLYLKALGA